MAKHVIRWAFFIFIFTLPFWNGFRMDIDNEKLFLFGFQLSYEAGYLFFVFLFLFLMAFLSIAMIIYRAFCQYACPHNTFSMLLNKIEAKSGGKGKALTFILSAVVSLFMAYSTVSFFYDPLTIGASLMNFVMNKYFFLVTSVAVIYTALSYKARNSFCKVCPYGLAQGISTVDDKARWLTHPGIWITWGTTAGLVLVLLVGWF
ncbi:4Fe-4S binding protein [Bacillus sp. REN3]|uniref:4Fe-4S binding protein n=1 Tax=Bacillus sp. REN3 TaxID=2802440 RepID=UPI001AEEA649